MSCAVELSIAGLVDPGMIYKDKEIIRSARFTHFGFEHHLYGVGIVLPLKSFRGTLSTKGTFGEVLAARIKQKRHTLQENDVTDYIQQRQVARPNA